LKSIPDEGEQRLYIFEEAERLSLMPPVGLCRQSDDSFVLASAGAKGTTPTFRADGD
jgi:hypothetical protein